VLGFYLDNYQMLSNLGWWNSLMELV
jgi:hypothetical protein